MGLTIELRKNLTVEKPKDIEVGRTKPKKKVKDLGICTWNVMSPHKLNILKLLIELIKYKADTLQSCKGLDVQTMA